MTDDMKEAVERVRLNLYKAVLNISDDALEQIIWESLPIRLRFEGRCPYTDKPCEDWNCNECEVEQEERDYLEEGYYDRT